MKPLPVGFQPFDPYKEVKNLRRKLHHWRQDGCTYFITFHTKDSLPKKALADLQRVRDEWIRLNPPPQDKEAKQELYRRLDTRTEHWLDQGFGDLPFAALESRKKLHKALLYFHGTEDDVADGNDRRVELGAFVVMPNHVHAVVRSLPGVELATWAGSVKQFSSRALGAAKKTPGPLWIPESYDRIVRDRNHLERCLRYIGKNPARARIDPGAADVLWLNPGWKTLGYHL